MADVASLIRNFVDLSVRLKGSPDGDAAGLDFSSPMMRPGTLGELNPITLQFKDPRLEAVYYCFCIGVWDSGHRTSWSLRAFSGFAGIYAMLFVVTFICSTPSGIAFKAFDIPPFSYSFVAMIFADLIFWMWYQYTRKYRDAAVVASGGGDWQPLLREMTLMNVVIIVMCSVTAIVSVLGENGSSEDYLNQFGS